MGSEHPGAVLFERHHLVIFRYFWRMTRRRDVAEDLTQDVFVRAVRGLGNYEPRNRDRAWLFEIARRLLLDHQRTTGRRGAMAELTDRDAATPPVQQLSVAIDQALDQHKVRPDRRTQLFFHRLESMSWLNCKSGKDLVFVLHIQA